METITKNQPKAGEFFILEPDTRRGGKGHGVVFENEEALLTPPRLILRPKTRGFPPLSEVPRLVYQPREGAPPQDLEGGLSGYWLVSDRLKKVMTEVDPDAFAFSETDYRLPDGSRGPSYFLCDVVRTVDALDEDASQLKILISDEYEAGKHYALTGDVRLAFKRDVLRSAHVFRLPYSGFVYCDSVFRSAVEASGISTESDPNGLWFDDVVSG